MDWTAAAEAAWENGHRAGFAEGIAAAGIAPIQWRAAANMPMPDKVDLILWTLDGDYYSGQLARSGRVGYYHMIVDRYGAAVWIPEDKVVFWAPIQNPPGTGKGGGIE